MYKAIYFVGADNTTKKLDRTAIANTFASHFEGFTISDAVGYWKGEQEPSARIEVLTDEPAQKLQEIARTLCTLLSQEAVLLEIERNEYEFISNSNQ